MTRHHLITDDGREIDEREMPTTPAELTPEHADAVIFAVMTTWPNRPHVAPSARSRIFHGERQAWSRQQGRWLSVTEYAAEWRHAYRYRQVMGNEETTRELTRYERQMGL